MALQESPYVHPERICWAELEYPGWEPGVAIPDWGFQERNAAGTACVSTSGDIALAKERSIVTYLKNPVPGSYSLTHTLILLTCMPAPPGP